MWKMKQLKQNTERLIILYRPRLKNCLLRSERLKSRNFPLIVSKNSSGL